MSEPARLYDVDFYRWTQEQAALLRQVPGERINLPIDWATPPKRSRTWDAGTFVPSTVASA